MTEREWISPGTVAAELRLCLSTVYRCIDRGELPAHRIGRRILVDRPDVDRFIEACRIQPGTLLSGQLDKRNNTTRGQDAASRE